MSATDLGADRPARRPRGPATAVQSLVWLCVAASVAALPITAMALQAYDYPHAWVSAHFATMARSFIEHGVLALGGVPVQNNPPLTATPDAYLNWPPLYPIVLSAVFSVFGESERVHHLVAAATNLGIAALVFAMVYRRGGVTAGALAVIAFLNAPLLAQYGHLGLHLHLALLLCLASLWVYARAIDPEITARGARARLATLGVVLFGLSVMTSWEPVLAVPGLIVLAIAGRHRPAFGLAVLYGAIGVTAVASVFVLYGAQYPYFADAIVERILLRAGFTPGYGVDGAEIFGSPHFIQEQSEPAGRLGLHYLATLAARLGALGPIGLIGLGLVLVRLPKLRQGLDPDLAYPLAGLAAMFGLWAVLMSQHMSIHDYQMLLLAPVAGLCVGLAAAKARETAGAGLPLLGPNGLRPAVLLSVLMLALIGRVPAGISLYVPDQADQAASIRFAEFVRDSVEPDAIVAHPDRSMVPVYYAKRHVIRAVADERVLAEHRAAIERLCADCPVYVAIPKAVEPHFQSLIARAPSRVEGDLGTIITLRPAP